MLLKSAIASDIPERRQQKMCMPISFARWMNMLRKSSMIYCREADKIFP